MDKQVANKPTKYTLEYWNYFNIEDWLVQKSIWTEMDSKFVWSKIIDGDFQGNDSFGNIMDEDSFEMVKYGEGDADQIRYVDLVTKLFTAIGEEDYFSTFLFSW